MNQSEEHVPSWEMEQRSRQQREARERHGVWERCATLLKDRETGSRTVDADDAAVLGYN